jgi:kumamolisin
VQAELAPEIGGFGIVRTDTATPVIRFATRRPDRSSAQDAGRGHVGSGEHDGAMTEDPTNASPPIADGRTVLPGSNRQAYPNTRRTGPVPGDETVEVTVVLRRRGGAPQPATGEVLSKAELEQRYGADPADIDLLTSIVTEAGATVDSVDPAFRRVKISGPASVVSELFGTSLERVSVPEIPGRPTTGEARVTEIRHRSGDLSVPEALGGVVTAVLGLDTRPQVRPHYRLAVPMAAATSYTPVELADIYQMPAGTDGAGQVIAIIELGGGFTTNDLQIYFGSLGITPPSVEAIGVDGATNSPGDGPNGADGEVMLDIEVAGAIAPDAAIKVYFAPNTDAGFLDAVVEAAQDSPTPVAMSISWGAAEDQWTAQARSSMDSAFADAAVLGVTVTAAAGDDGSNDRVGDGKPHADFPASSPHVLGCGGTSLQADTVSGQVQSEVVWNDGTTGGATGGGVSAEFPLPDWQANAGVPNRPDGSGTGRGVPDVSANADPQTGYQVRVDGQNLVFGGTSAVAPLWAALVARLVQSLGRPLGLLQASVYAESTTPGAAPPGFRDVTSGNNGAFSAGPGWDACTGLGVPVGGDLLAALQSTGGSGGSAG